MSADQLTPILDRKLVFVTGRGGTGGSPAAKRREASARRRIGRVMVALVRIVNINPTVSVPTSEIRISAIA